MQQQLLAFKDQICATTCYASTIHAFTQLCVANAKPHNTYNTQILVNEFTIVQSNALKKTNKDAELTQLVNLSCVAQNTNTTAVLQLHNQIANFINDAHDKICDIIQDNNVANFLQACNKYVTRILDAYTQRYNFVETQILLTQLIVEKEKIYNKCLKCDSFDEVKINLLPYELAAIIRHEKEALAFKNKFTQLLAYARNDNCVNL